MFLDPRTSFSHHKRSGKKLCAAQRWHFPRPWADWWEPEGLFLDGRMDRYSNIFLPLCRDRNSILTTPGSTRNVRLSDMSAGSGPQRENSLFSIQLKGWRQVKKGLKDTAGWEEDRIWSNEIRSSFWVILGELQMSFSEVKNYCNDFYTWALNIYLM